MRKWWKPVVFVTFCMVLLALAGVTALAKEAVTSDKVAQSDDANALVGVESLAQSATASPWTAEMIANAQPMALPVLSDSDLAALAETAVPTGPGERFAGAPPTLRSPVISRELLDPSLGATVEVGVDDEEYVEVGAQAIDGYSYPPPFTRYPVNSNWQMHKYYPFTAIGKLYFQIPNTSGTYSCSGGVGYERVVWTAGHCVFTPGKGWHYNMIFIPAYKGAGSDQQPYGQFTVTAMQSLNGWINSGNNAYDIAMVRVNDKSGKKLSQYTGYLGFSYNQSSTQHFHAFGYPANINDGKYLYVCAASTSRLDPKTGPDPVGIGCDMQHGSSGGPWLTSYRPYASGAINYVNSVVSYGKTGYGKEFFGPYFSDGAKNLYDWGKAQ